MEIDQILFILRRFTAVSSKWQYVYGFRLDESLDGPDASQCELQFLSRAIYTIISGVICEMLQHESMVSVGAVFIFHNRDTQSHILFRQARHLVCPEPAGAPEAASTETASDNYETKQQLSVWQYSACPIAVNR